MFRWLPLIALLMVPIPLSAATLIDTGFTSPLLTARPVNPKTTLLAQFTLGSNTQIQSVENFGRPVTSGDARYTIYADAGSKPGLVLHQTTTSFIQQRKSSYWGISGLAWNLLAGSYWVEVAQASPSFTAMVVGSAPNPLAFEGAFKPGGFVATDAVDLSWRIGGDFVSAIPEPATWGMMILGFAIVGGAIRIQRRRGLLPVSSPA